MDEVLHRALLSHPERVGRRGSKARHWRCLSWQGTDWGGVLILSKAQKSVPGTPHPGAGAMLCLIDAWRDVVASFPFVRDLLRCWLRKTGKPSSGAVSDAQ